MLSDDIGRIYRKFSVFREIAFGSHFLDTLYEKYRADKEPGTKRTKVRPKTM